MIKHISSCKMCIARSSFDHFPCYLTCLRADNSLYRQSQAILYLVSGRYLNLRVEATHSQKVLDSPHPEKETKAVFTKHYRLEKLGPLRGF